MFFFRKGGCGGAEVRGHRPGPEGPAAGHVRGPRQACERCVTLRTYSRATTMFLTWLQQMSVNSAGHANRACER